MITLNCAGCNRPLKVKDELAGKRVRCPSCQAICVIPDVPVLEVEPVEEERPRRGRRNEEESESHRQGIRRAVPGDRRRRVEEDDEFDEEDRPGRRSRRDEDDEEDEDRPRRKKSVCCPKCGSRKSTKVHWTPFGGFIAPLIINMVRCSRCGTGYNGKHGDYNTGRLTIFYVICVVIGLAIGIISAIAEAK